MRCGCPECGMYMVQSEGMEINCVCPGCGYRCSACLGTNTVISKEKLERLKGDVFFEEVFRSREKKN